MFRSLILALTFLFLSCSDNDVISYKKCKKQKHSREASINCNSRGIDLTLKQLGANYFVNDQAETLLYVQGELADRPIFQGRWIRGTNCDPTWIYPLQNSLCKDNITGGEYLWPAFDTMFNYLIIE